MQFSREEFDFNELQQDAQQRWLKPAEVFFILQNHERFKITSEPPNRPPSGSLFLFNRRILRFFRKDGYNWRKKRDGRTVGEAHERLKVGNVDALNCYYAHGEENPNFQRRSYWMLDEAYDHIVLVHYREVSEVRSIPGYMSNTSTYNSQNISFSDPQNSSHVRSLDEVYDTSWNSQSPGSFEEVSSTVISAADYGKDLVAMDRTSDFGFQSKSEVKQTLLRLAEQLSLDDDNIYYPENVPSYPSLDKSCLISGVPTSTINNLDQHMLINPLTDQEQDQHLHGSAKAFAGSFLQNPDFQRKPHAHPWSEGVETKASPSWKEMLDLYSSSSAPAGKRSNQVGVEYGPRSSRNITNNLGGVSAMDHSSATISYNGELPQFSEKDGISVNHDGQHADLSWSWEDAQGENISCQPSADNLSQQLSAARHFLLGSDSSNNLVPPTSATLSVLERPSGSPTLLAAAVHDDGHHIAIVGRSNSLEWAKDLNLSCDKYSPEYYGTLFDQEDLGQLPEADSCLSVSQVLRFTIQELSPEWAYSTEGSKVIVIGDFLCDPSEYTWYCMFGNIEVPVEVLPKGVLRCQAPPHATGKVPFCITCGNRESCSEVREFEYRFKPHGYPLVYIQPDETLSTREELLLLVRLSQMVLLGHMHVSTENNMESKSTFSDPLQAGDNQWEGIIDSILDGSESTNMKDWLLEKLLKARLEQWLSEKCQNSETATSLTKHEQSIIHMIAGLGYEWALSPVLKSGIVVNFRDNSGWTALHWAARFGRERMVAALLAAGASAGAVTDPTSQEPSGRTAAAIAAAGGHKGLAAYLSEAALTSHLSLLTLGETEISKGSANLEAERTVESISARSSIQLHMDSTADDLALKQSLAAMRNAAQAAARIQSAFRAHSFRRRQQKLGDSCDECGMTQSDIRGIVAASKLHKGSRNVRDHKLDIAATRIQRKYLSWKGRKDFLTLRRNAVKIQAHVRGHQVRKKYKEFLWTVGVTEKAILRWRRKGAGLRGFRADESFDEDEDEDILKVFRKQKVDLSLEEALSRVLSLVDSPEARQQYQRILDSYNKVKAEREAKDSMEADILNQFSD